MISYRRPVNLTKRDAYTVGQAMTATGYSRRKVMDLCDSGQLRSFRCPGTGQHRKIPHQALIGYLLKHQLPIPHEIE